VEAVPEAAGITQVLSCSRITPRAQVRLHGVVVTLAMRFLAVALLAASASAVIKVGDTLPSVTLDLGFPPEKVNLLERAKGKNVILMGLPGAFTPT
tara:strand:- start:445 stop:732 length:288 start_codon:yes stop_codon:yes gene_type:complete